MPVPRGGKWTIRPNVASGGVGSALVALVFIILGLFQGETFNDEQLKQITVALTVLLPLAFAYFAPADSKTIYNAAGGVVALIVAIVLASAYGLTFPETFQTAFGMRL